jgi:hypothetical protein
MLEVVTTNFYRPQNFQCAMLLIKSNSYRELLKVSDDVHIANGKTTAA